MGKNNELPVAKQIWIIEVLCGSAWLIGGVAGLIDHPVFDTVFIVACVAAIAMQGWVLTAKKERYDEMADMNYNKARANAATITRLVSAIAGIGLILISAYRSEWLAGLRWETVLIRALFIVFGIENILTGILFKRYEEE